MGSTGVIGACAGIIGILASGTGMIRFKCAYWGGGYCGLIGFLPFLSCFSLLLFCCWGCC